jgi:hypothetical protein
MTESMGWAVAMAVNTSNTFDSSAKRLEFVSHNIKETIAIEDDDGMRGTRTRASERVAMGNITIAGSITFQPSPAEWEVLLPYLLGGPASSGTFALADTLPDMFLMVDHVAKVNTYLLRVTSGTISGEPGKKIKLMLNVVGKTLTIGNAGTFPGTVPAIDTTSRPYMMYDLASGITIAGVAYSIDKFELQIDNKIEPTYMQGQTATDLEPTDRIISLGIQTKYTSTETVLHNAARTGTVQGASVGFTNGGVSLTMTFAGLVATAESPQVPGRQHLRLPLNYHAYGVGTTKEMVLTSDSTP